MLLNLAIISECEWSFIIDAALLLLFAAFTETSKSECKTWVQIRGF